MSEIYMWVAQQAIAFLQLEIQTQISITHLASVKCKCRFVVRLVIVVNDVLVSNMEVF